MIIIYPLGIPALYATMVWANRATLSDAAAMEREAANNWPTVGHLKFLVLAYRSELYFFEVFECGRRLALASAIGMLDPSSAASAVLGLLISYGCIYVFQRFEPFKNVRDNALGITLAYSLTLFFTAALMIKTNATGTSPEEQSIFGACLVVVLAAGPIFITYGEAVEMLPALKTAILGSLSKKEINDPAYSPESEDAESVHKTLKWTPRLSRAKSIDLNPTAAGKRSHRAAIML